MSGTGGSDIPRCGRPAGSGVTAGSCNEPFYALERGADGINIPAGAERDNTGQASSFLADAIAECERQGTVVVAAAGNDGSESPHTFQRSAKPSSSPAEWMPAGDLCRSRTGTLNTAVTGCWLRPDPVGARVGGGVATGTGTSYAAAVVSERQPY